MLSCLNKQLAMHRNCHIRYSSELIRKLEINASADKLALKSHSSNDAYTYRSLLTSSLKLAEILNKSALPNTTTIGAFNKSDFGFVTAMLATWRLGKTFVPLCSTHSENELSYVAKDSALGAIVCSDISDVNSAFKSTNSSIPLISTSDVQLHSDNISGGVLPPPFDIINSNPDRDALIIYTSGTTGRPKGVVHTDSGVTHMIKSLVQAWEYNENDRILHFLPLYHVHGLLNKLLTVLWVGGTVEFLKSAKAEHIWERLAAEQTAESDPKHGKFQPISLFMGVPTVYAKMIEAARTTVPPEQLQQALLTLKGTRLMACGSAALPDPVMNDWKALTGATLLERYGMTELGMALTNPYRQERRKGTVGQPFPGVNCRLVDEEGREIKTHDTPGELRVKGPTVFTRYLNLPKVTAESFDGEGWFLTGDMAAVSQDGYYRILGRMSSDIIKSSGYKLSALEIERELLGHPQIMEAAVLGVPDAILGEKIVAIIVLRPLATPAATPTTAPGAPILSLTDSRHTVNEHVRAFLKDKLAGYKHPRDVAIVDALPRNHLGKVNKKRLLQDLNIKFD